MNTYYYSISRPYIMSGSREGLLIRGIPESDIATIEAVNRWEAGDKITNQIK